VARGRPKSPRLTKLMIFLAKIAKVLIMEWFKECEMLFRAVRTGTSSRARHHKQPQRLVKFGVNARFIHFTSEIAWICLVESASVAAPALSRAFCGTWICV
jgi:hypothetical protein